MPSKNLTLRIKEKDQAIISALLKLNRKNFFPKNIDNRTALFTLLIETIGQQLLDAAQEGKNFDQVMNNRVSLTQQDFNSIRLMHTNSKRMLYMLVTLMNGTLPNSWLEEKGDYLQSFVKLGSLSQQTLKAIDNQLSQDEQTINKHRSQTQR